MTKQSTSSILSEIEIFKGLSKKEIGLINKLMSAIRISAGKEFIKEGASGREAFIILDGTASVWRHGKLVASVGPGAVIGEMAVIANSPRTATVKAETDMVVEVLNRGAFLQLLDESPGLTRKLLTATITRLQQLEPTLLS
ncbi:MAG: cyclic nucleotide-binding domain-containing protein [Ilumatobacter sp.]|nr:cyclic nucleotide-binding domain-containing protein [Ilumatobacter sp.]